MSEGFLVNADIAELFFQYCLHHNVTDPAHRVAVLRELVKQKQAAYLRDPERFLKGKRIIKIQPKRGHA